MPRKSNRRIRHSPKGTRFFAWIKVRMPLFAGLAVLILVLFGGIFIIGNFFPNIFGYPTSISPARAMSEINKGAFVLDVRATHDEYEQGHIAGGLWISLEDLPTRLADLPQDRLIIVVCRTGVRSAEAVKILRANGFPRSTSLSGGLSAWSLAGYRIVAAPATP
jgi:rhodanese-related sulfurtransferase